MGPDGVPVKEKLSPIPYNRKVVDPAGNVVTLNLATGYTIRAKNNPYGIQIMAEKLKAGFLPYDECPVATGRIKPGPKQAACTETFSKEKCCPHLADVIKARQAAHKKKQDEFMQSFKTNNERMLEVFEEQMRQNVGG